MKEHVKRGRPRTFDEDQTLDRIMQVFWKNGYSATSLDQIAAASGLNRPSLYAAFGSKKDMYLRTVERFASEMENVLRAAAQTESGVKAKMKAILAAAIDVYTGKTPLTGCQFGCLAISTLPPETSMDEDFQVALKTTINRMDTQFAALIHHGSKGAVNEQDALEIAQHLAMILHGVSVRARAGEDPEGLKALTAAATGRLLPDECP